MSYLGDSQHGGPSLRRHGRALATAAAGGSSALEWRLKHEKTGGENRRDSVDMGYTWDSIYYMGDILRLVYMGDIFAESVICS